MNYAVMVLSIGMAGIILASNTQAPASAASESLLAALSPSPEITHSTPLQTAPPRDAIRLIDLRGGTTCKLAGPVMGDASLRRVPMGPDCAASAALASVVYWRATPEGSLIMADGHGKTVLEFAPGDGVLYESIYPEDALITIVPARG